MFSNTTAITTGHWETTDMRLLRGRLVTGEPKFGNHLQIIPLTLPQIYMRVLYHLHLFLIICYTFSLQGCTPVPGWTNFLYGRLPGYPDMTESIIRDS